MFQFCSKCGTPLTDDAAFCCNCGTAVAGHTPSEPAASEVIPAEQAQPQVIPAEEAQPRFIPADQVQPSVAPAAPAATAEPAKKKISRKTLLIGGAVAAVAIIAIVLIIVLTGNKNPIATPEGALDNYFAFYNGDMDCLQNMAPDAYWDYLAKQQGISKDKVLSNLKTSFSNFRKYYEENFGKDVKFSYTVNDQENVDISTVFDIGEALSRYGIKETDVTEAKQMEITMIISGSEDRETETEEMYMVKIGDNWYMIYYYNGYANFAVG